MLATTGRCCRTPSLGLIGLADRTETDERGDKSKSTFWRRNRAFMTPGCGPSDQWARSRESGRVSAFVKGNTVNGLSIRDLIDEGRK